MPPGLHYFIIYDPKSGRAFYKEIIVDLDFYDSYPEFPEPFSEEAKEVKKKKK